MRGFVPLVAYAALLLPAAAAADTGERLQAAIEQVVAEHPSIPGVVLHVDGPRRGLPFDGAAGSTALLGGEPLHPKDPYRLSSTMKLYTGAGVMRLVEERRLSLGDPVAPFLDPEQADTMHVHEGVNHGRAVTIRQLLNHTSGLNSHDACNEFTLKVAAQADRRWTPRELIQEMIDCGDAHFAPGAGYSYSDTGYVILSEVLRRAGDSEDYAAALRRLLPFEELRLRHTWHELLEPVPPGTRDRAHQYAAAYDFYGHDPSFDAWGGGGYVATARDVASFLRALMEGRVLRPATMRSVRELVAVPPGDGGVGGDGYGLGVRHYTIEGLACWGHHGFFGSFSLYCPSLDVAIAGSTNQAMGEGLEHTERHVIVPVLRILREAAALTPSLQVRPRRLVRGRATIVRLRLTAGGRGVSGARARARAAREITDAAGRARLRVRPRRETVRVSVCKQSFGCKRAALAVRAPRQARGAAGPG